MDTVEANLALGFPEDLRDYGIGRTDSCGLQNQRLRLVTK